MSSSGRKKIILITETPPSENGTGASQTLYNLFENYGSELMSVVSPVHILKQNFVSDQFSKKIFGFKSSFIKLGFLNRVFGLKLIEGLNRILFSIFSEGKIIKCVVGLRPEMLFISNADYYTVKLAYKILQKNKIPFYIYLQDNINDGLGTQHTARVNFLMQQAQGWLLISEYMYEDILKRYSLPNKLYLVVHNPVKRTSVKEVQPKELSAVLNIVYAGAIWPMHFDALQKIIMALPFLKNIKVKITLYTQKYFWDTYARFFESNHIDYGGFLPFKDLRNKIISADALLVTSSFSKEAEVLTKYSVQTKITDYMAAGIPIISIGPEYSACNKFIQKLGIGTLIQTQEPIKIAEVIDQFAINYHDKLKLANVAREVVLKEHTQEVVEQKLFNFIDGI